MEFFSWALLIFAVLLIAFLFFKIIKGLFKLVVFFTSLILIFGALLFTYSLVIDKSFTGMVTAGVNYTKSKINDFVGEKTKELKNLVVSEALNLTRETSKEFVKNNFFNFTKKIEEKEKLINKDFSS